ncbi:efflux transporter outer membrane subunit [Arcobacter porcinus]|uniref:RND family efflux system, outer membrane channel protein, TolC family n=1 Tax=Arcobacter porcinus TaxID=1935204 RepID=A0A5C2HFC9_9BACT|nr:TolC family protein [Arcobacter porcinus]OCL97393.1 Toluene efflux pump outer membrane protein TtgI precursor [Aliarcobacter thereius]QEP41599.1 RND family efflux system, outer membrane channel protein, TolC family [Arcobacter porcinus]
MFRYIFYFIIAISFVSCTSMQPTLNLEDKEFTKESFKNYEQNRNDNFEEFNSNKFLKDEKLKTIINLVLENNKSLEIALLKIESSKALYGIQTSNLFPKIDAKGSLDRTKASDYTNPNNQISNNYKANITASFELDLFGKNQSLNDAAKNSFLATKYAYNSTKLILISETINTYLKLASSLENQKLSNEILKNLEETYSLTSKKYVLGATSKQEMLASLASLKEMENRSLEFENEVAKSINALEFLLSSKLDENLMPSEFLKSDYIDTLNYQIESNVLLNRPDIKEFEFKLREKNANIGAARAAFFPSISLTASTGYASNSLSGLFSNQNTFWQISPSINIPIFTAGENIKRLEYSKKEQEIALKEYEKAIQTAFKEVNDTLAIRKNIASKLENYSLLLESLKDTYNIVLNSYKIGKGSYLSLLIAQKEYINAKIAYTNLVLSELENRVDIFKTLGGEIKE